MAQTFRQLHQPGKPFILANAWDAGSARLLAASGAQAIGTTSAGHAFTLGLKDMGHVDRDQALQHAQDLIAATPLPVSGDFENGYGDSPQQVAATISQAGAIGLAGCSIEDTRLPSSKPYELALATERIEAAVEAAGKLAQDFVLVARADGVMNGYYDVDEAIRRIQAFARSGADVLYVPMPPSMEDLARICRSVEQPVNALAAGDFARYSVDQFAAIGVARISLGSALARACHNTLLKAAQGMFGAGDFSPLLETVSGVEVDMLLDRVQDQLEQTR